MAQWFNKLQSDNYEDELFLFFVLFSLYWMPPETNQEVESETCLLFCNLGNLSMLNTQKIKSFHFLST